MDSQLLRIKQSLGDSLSPLESSLCLNVFTVISHVFGDPIRIFGYPPTMRWPHISPLDSHLWELLSPHSHPSWCQRPTLPRAGPWRLAASAPMEVACAPFRGRAMEAGEAPTRGRGRRWGRRCPAPEVSLPLRRWKRKKGGGRAGR
jgi:hypothetical protein